MISSKRSRGHQAYLAGSPATQRAVAEANSKFSHKEVREEELRKEAQKNASIYATQLYHTQLASYTGGQHPKSDMVYTRGKDGVVHWDPQADIPLICKQFATIPQVEPLQKFAASSQERSSLVTQNLIYSGQNSNLASQEYVGAVMEGVIRSTANAQSNRDRIPISQTSGSRRGYSRGYVEMKDSDEKVMDRRFFGKEDSTALRYTGSWQPGNLPTHYDYRIEMEADIDYY